jgi:hypothetical protein
MSKKARVWNGSSWQDLASATADLSSYANLNTTPISGFRNLIINGGMDVWQRGTSNLPIGNASVASSTTVDRWASFRPANPTAITVSRISGTGVPGAFYGARIQRTSGNTTVDKVTFGQTLEIADASSFTGRTITLSFYARAGTNFSPTGSVITNILKTGTGTTDLNGIYNSYTGESVTSGNNTLTTSFQRFTRTVSLASNVTQIAIIFDFTPTGTAGTNDFVDITGVQLEIGNIATPFEHRAIGTELALCQRYYYRMVQGGTATRFAFGSNISAVEWNSHSITPPVTMRETPTQLGSGTGAISNGTSYEFTGVNLNTGVTVYNLVSSPTNIILRVPGLSGMNAFRPAWLETYSGASFLAFSAEL